MSPLRRPSPPPGVEPPTRFPIVRWSADFGAKSRPMVRRSRRKPHGIQKLGVVARDGIEPSTRGFSVRRRARFGASKSKTGKGFPPVRPNRPSRPSPSRTGTVRTRLNFAAPQRGQRLTGIATEPFPNRAPNGACGSANLKSEAVLTGELAGAGRRHSLWQRRSHGQQENEARASGEAARRDRIGRQTPRFARRTRDDPAR